MQKDKFKTLSFFGKIKEVPKILIYEQNFTKNHFYCSPWETENASDKSA